MYITLSFRTYSVIKIFGQVFTTRTVTIVRLRYITLYMCMGVTNKGDRCENITHSVVFCYVHITNYAYHKRYNKRYRKLRHKYDQRLISLKEFHDHSIPTGELVLRKIMALWR